MPWILRELIGDGISTRTSRDVCKSGKLICVRLQQHICIVLLWEGRRIPSVRAKGATPIHVEVTRVDEGSSDDDIDGDDRLREAIRNRGAQKWIRTIAVYSAVYRGPYAECRLAAGASAAT